MQKQRMQALVTPSDTSYVGDNEFVQSGQAVRGASAHGSVKLTCNQLQASSKSRCNERAA